MIGKLARFPLGFVALMRGSSAASSVVQSLGVRIALLAVNMATGIIVARALAPAGRGELAAMSLWPILIAGLTAFGLPSALTVFTVRMGEAGGRLLTAGAIWVVAVGFISAAAASLALPFWLHGYDEAVIAEARWLLLFTPQCLLLGLMRAHLESRREFARSMLSQFFPAFCTLLVLGVLAPLHWLTPAAAPWAYFGPGAIQTLWLVGRLRARFVVSTSTLFADTRRLLSYGLRAYGSEIIGTISTQVDQALIITFLNPRALGLYVVGLSTSRVMNITQQSLATVLVQRAIAAPRDEVVAFIARVWRLNNALSIVLGAGFIALLPFAVPLVYGHPFAAAIPITQLLTIEAVLSGSTSIRWMAFGVMGRPFLLTMVQFFWLCATAGALVVLVPRMGIEGAAYALLASSCARFALVAVLYRVVFGSWIARFLPDRADIAYLLHNIRR